MIRKKIPRWLAGGLFILFGVAICLPVLMLVSGSLADGYEWRQRTIGYLRETQEYISWRWIPDYPTLEHYKRLLFFSPAFFKLFWNSIGMTAGILLGQLVIAVPAAWAFAMYRFRGKRVLFSLYVILMLLPFQVTMLSKYLVLQDAGLINTRWAVILPAIFSTFPVFLIYRSFAAIPAELLEAARVDGASTWRTYWSIIFPIMKPMHATVAVLTALGTWNDVMTPLVIMSGSGMNTLPLAQMTFQTQFGTNYNLAFASYLLALIPILIFYLVCQKQILNGVVNGAVK